MYVLWLEDRYVPYTLNITYNCTLEATCIANSQNLSIYFSFPSDNQFLSPVGFYISVFFRKDFVFYYFFCLVMNNSWNFVHWAIQTNKLGIAYLHDKLGIVYLHDKLGIAYLHYKLGIAYLHDKLGIAYIHDKLGIAYLRWQSRHILLILTN